MHILASILGFAADLKALLLDFAWQLCAFAAVVLAIAGAVPLPQFRYARHLALVLALAAANLQGRSGSSAHHRLKEAREALAREQRVVAWQSGEIRRQTKMVNENENRVRELAESLLAAQLSAAEARRDRETLERENADVRTYFEQAVPPSLRGSFGSRRVRK